jgi:uncharacterized protein YdiU (UPF0061 family)
VPPGPAYQPQAAILELGDGFFDAVRAARFPEHRLRFRNQRWAEEVGLGELSVEEWEAAFGRFEALPENLQKPLALRYHGHQFRHYNADLGDGRGFLFAQLRDSERLLDLATKGSGQTPYSRAGDGRLTLKGGVREVLATEMLEALGVYTSKSFSLFETGEELVRHDEPSPTRSSVLVRLGHSHLRFGTFERQAFHRRADRIEALVDYAVKHYCPEICHFESGKAVALLNLVVERSARLCAEWMVAGFVHGVLNTDNMNLTGESFDYGPYRFLPTCDPSFTAAYFDHSGLYAYGRQPEAVYWNLMRFADTLSLIEKSARLDSALRRFQDEFSTALDAQFLRRLGLRSRNSEDDRRLRQSGFLLMQRSAMPFERFFFEHYARGDLSAELGGAGEFQELFKRYEAGAERGDYFAGDAPCTLLIEEIESIWADIDERDDWAAFEGKIAEIRAAGASLAWREESLASERGVR